MNMWVTIAVGITLGGSMVATASDISEFNWVGFGNRLVLAQVGGESVSEDLVNLFAKVVLKIEPYRQAAQTASSNAGDSEERNEIRRQFIRQATEIIEDNGMTVADYNRIAIELRQDEKLRGEIETAIRDLQQNEA